MSNFGKRLSHASVYLTASLPIVQGGWLVITGSINVCGAFFDASIDHRKAVTGAVILKCFTYGFAMSPDRLIWYWWPLPVVLYMFLKSFATWKQPEAPQKPSMPVGQSVVMEPLAALKAMQYQPVSAKGLRHVPAGFHVICSYGLMRVGKRINSQLREIVWTPDGPFPMVTECTLTLAEPQLDEMQGRGWMIWLRKAEQNTPIGFASPARQKAVPFVHERERLANLEAGTADYLVQCVSMIVDDLSQNNLFFLETAMQTHLTGGGVVDDGLLP